MTLSFWPCLLYVLHVCLFCKKEVELDTNEHIQLSERVANVVPGGVGCLITHLRVEWKFTMLKRTARTTEVDLLVRSMFYCCYRL